MFELLVVYMCVDKINILLKITWMFTTISGLVVVDNRILFKEMFRIVF